MRQRVAAEIKTTFASTYTEHVSLIEALSPDADRRLRPSRRPARSTSSPRTPERRRFSGRTGATDDAVLSEGLVAARSGEQDVDQVVVLGATPSAASLCQERSTISG